MAPGGWVPSCWAGFDRALVLLVRVHLGRVWRGHVPAAPALNAAPTVLQPRAEQQPVPGTDDAARAGREPATAGLQLIDRRILQGERGDLEPCCWGPQRMPAVVWYMKGLAVCRMDARPFLGRAVWGVGLAKQEGKGSCLCCCGGPLTSHAPAWRVTASGTPLPRATSGRPNRRNRCCAAVPFPAQIAGGQESGRVAGGGVGQPAKGAAGGPDVGRWGLDGAWAGGGRAKHDVSCWQG